MATSKLIESLHDLLPDDHNANRGTARGAELIERSLRGCGAGRSVLADRNGRLIAGNKTVASAARAGMEGVIVVPSDGSKLVVVQRTDLDLETDQAARELAVLDNRAGELSLEWDAEELQRTADQFDINLVRVGFTGEELEALLADAAPPLPEPGGEEKDLEVKEAFGVLVECADEKQQREIYQRLTREGLSCRLSML